MKLITLLSFSILLVSCNNQEKQVYKTVYQESSYGKKSEHPGKKLLETYCYICHNPTTPENGGRIAPPMIAIKTHYKNDDITKEEFINQIVSYASNPTQEKAKLFGAVRRFGVMPKQQFPEGVLEKIAEYIYDYEIEEPEWFKDHMKENGFGKFSQNGKKMTQSNMLKTLEDIGLEYALSTKKVLGQNLMGTIQKKGTLAALEFCNIKAIPLTDSMSTKNQAAIKRVTNKPRNPNNKANAEELKYIEIYKQQIVTNQVPEPIVIEKNNKIKFYYPITTNTMCLQCHGKEADIKPEVKTKLLKLYPNDLAYGYSENEVRGIWSIEFNKPKNN
jgi:nitrate reductase cytochrome c-type subunit